MSTAPLSAARKLQALSRCDVFSRVPNDTLGVLAEMMETESLRTGDVLFEQGEPSDRVYVVVDGAVLVTVAGRAEPVRTMRPGELLGEYGMVVAGLRTATVRAAEDAQLVSLDYERFRSFLRQFPDATFALLATAVRRLIEAEKS